MKKPPNFERKHFRASIRQKKSWVFLLNVILELFRLNTCFAIY